MAEIAVRHGFRSATTFALEFRKRFGAALSKVRRVAPEPEHGVPLRTPVRPGRRRGVGATHLKPAGASAKNRDAAQNRR